MKQSATLQFLPDGPAGTRATLRAMAALVREYRKKLPVRNLALAIVRGVPTSPGNKNFMGMASALTNWVRNNIQYVRDITDVETLQTPAITLRNGQGDCDDQSTLLASLLEAVGFETRFVAIKTDPSGPFVHVLAEANIGGRWTPLETTENWVPGDFPVNAAARMVENVNGNGGLLSGFLGWLGSLGGVSATDLFSGPESSVLSSVWPSIRVAANWTDPNWGAMGYPNGPPLSANSNAIIGAVWGSVRRAARFSDINWSAENIPASLIPTAPVVAAPAPVVATPNYNGSPVDSISYQVISGAWPQIRVAANWSDINWQALGLSPPNLDAAAQATIAQYWPQIRVARWFSDINWEALKTPAAQPVPELPPKFTAPPAAPTPRASTPSAPAPSAPAPSAPTPSAPTPQVSTPLVASEPAAQPVPEITGGSSGGSSTPVAPFVPYDWSWLFGTPQPQATSDIVPEQLAPGDSGTGLPVITATGTPVQAGMFGNAKTFLIMAALGGVAALYYGKKGRRRNRRKR